MSVLFIEAQRIHTCHYEEGGVRVRKNDNLSQLRQRAFGVHVKCRGYSGKCSEQCALAKLLSRLEDIRAIEPVTVVSSSHAKLFRTGKLIRLEEVYSYEK